MSAKSRCPPASPPFPAVTRDHPTARIKIPRIHHARPAGFSLWLVPPESSRVYQALSALIATALPSQFPAASPPEFGPHVTLTSDVFSEAFSQSQDEEQQKRDAQAWLDGLALPTGRDGKVRFEALDVGERFVQKLTLRVRHDGVRELASVSRLHGVEKGQNEAAVETWLNTVYKPHCSLV